MKNSDPEREHDDQAIEEMLASLKRLAPPLETRVANREAVAAELARTAERRRAQAVPFWRRTVAVPWPVAAAGAAMLVTLSILLSLSVPEPTEVTDQELPHDRGRLEQPLEDRSKGASEAPALAYHESTTYFCGIGPLRSEARYLFEEPK